MYYGYYPPYVPVAKRKAQAAKWIAKRRKAGHAVAPVVVDGRVIARTFWGESWCSNLERYSDIANRLGKGRTYVRNGYVVHLEVASAKVLASVLGSEVYAVKVSLKSVPAPRWRALKKDCAGSIGSLVELLEGRLSDGVMERICRQETGLFPAPSEIRFECSCPDDAEMCKHVAAVLYGIGSRLDSAPELLFRLRAVDEKDLLASAESSLSNSGVRPAAARVLDSAADLSAVFGLEMASGTSTPIDATPTPKTKSKPRHAKRDKSDKH